MSKWYEVEVVAIPKVFLVEVQDNEGEGEAREHVSNEIGDFHSMEAKEIKEDDVANAKLWADEVLEY